MFGHQKQNTSQITSPMASSKPKKKFDPMENEAQKLQKEKEASDAQKQQVNEMSAESAEKRKIAKEAGRTDTEEFFKKDVEGLSPEKRKAMQYEANKGIHRSHQAANRKLLGEQSQKGIMGQGGVGFAQQKDLQKMAMEAEGGVVRDLDKLNSDLAMKKLAAMFAGGEGAATQAQLDDQLALDQLQLAEEKKKQKFYEDQISNLFNRI